MNPSEIISMWKQKYGVAAEGNIPHMYVDSKGYVTIGIGHCLTVQEDKQAGSKDLTLVKGILKKYKFTRARNQRTIPGAAAGKNVQQFTDLNSEVKEAQVEEEFNFLTDHRLALVNANYSAKGQSKFTTLNLAGNGSESLFNDDVLSKLNDLSRIIRTRAHKPFNDFPTAAQVALLDMHFNGALRQVKGLIASGASWSKVAASCNRSNVNAERNTITRNLFNEAELVQRILDKMKSAMNGIGLNSSNPTSPFNLGVDPARLGPSGALFRNPFTLGMTWGDLK